MRFSLAIIAVAAAIAGCSTLKDACKAKSEVAAQSRDDYVGDSGPVELGDCSLASLVDFAMTNRPSIVKSRLAVEDARLELRTIAADAPILSDTPWTAPQVAASLKQTETSDARHFDHLSAKTDGSALGTMELSVPLWDFGRYDAQRKAQCERVLAAELDLIGEGYEVFLDVADTYFTLLEKAALLEVAYTNEAEYAEHLVRAERRHVAGDIKEYDVQRSRLDLAQAREETVDAEKEAETAGAEFLRALGIDASHGVRREVIDFPGNALTFAMRGFPDTDCDVREAYALGVTNSPAVRLARAKLRGATHDVDYAVNDMFPELNATVTISWTDPLWVWHWAVGGAQQLFMGFKRRTAVERAVVAMRSAAADLEAAEQDLSVSIEKAIAARDSAKKARETAAESLIEAKANLELARKQYEVGDIPRIEYTTAVADYVRAMGSGISAFYSAQRAEAAIFSLLGTYPVYEEKRLTKEVR